MSDVRQKVRSKLAPFAQRLTSAIEAAGGLARIVKELGKSRATLDRWMNAQAAPSLLDIADVAKLCNVSLEWLATGAEQPDTGTVIPAEVSDVVYVPILDAGVAAGLGALNDDLPEQVGTWPFTRGFLRRIGAIAERARILFVSGDSMEPTLHDRDPVMVDVGHRDIQHGFIYAISTPDGLIVKRIQRNVDGSITLISDNKDFYPPERLSSADAERLQIIGRVHWQGRLV